MKTWAEVSESEAFKGMRAEAQEGARQQYFEAVVKPQVPAEHLDAARAQFDSQTYIRKRDLAPSIKPSDAGAGRGIGGPTAEQLQAAGRATVPVARRSLADVDPAQGMTVGDMAESAVPLQAEQNADLGPLDRPGQPQTPQPSLIDRRGAPVSEQTFAKLTNELAAMPRAQRIAAQSNPAAPGWMRAAAVQINVQLDASEQGARRVKAPGITADSRAESLIDQGMRGDLAQAKAEGDMTRGMPAQILPQMTAGKPSLLTPEEEMAAKRKGREVSRGSFAERAAFGAQEGVAGGTAGLMAAALRAAGDDDTAAIYEKVGQAASVRADASSELQMLQARARDSGMLPDPLLAGPADWLERQGVAAANSVGQMAPGLAAGLTGSGGLGMALMVAPVFGQSYIAGREAGKSPGAAAAYAAPMAALEWVGERYGLLPAAMKALRDKAATKSIEELPGWAEKAIASMEKRGLFSKPVGAVLRTQAGEQIGEQITGAGQYLLDGTEFGLDKPISLVGFLENARDTAVQTLLATGAIQAAGHGVKGALKQGGAQAGAMPAQSSAEPAQAAPTAAKPDLAALRRQHEQAIIDSGQYTPEELAAAGISVPAPAPPPLAAQTQRVDPTLDAPQSQAIPAADLLDDDGTGLASQNMPTQDQDGLPSEGAGGSRPLPESAPIDVLDKNAVLGALGIGGTAAPSVAAPATPIIATPVDQRAHAAATSPTNERAEPTPAQKEAGNYAKGHVRIAGMDMAIENPQGSIRRGVDKDGTAWENTLQSHYGYIKGTLGNDKDHVDAFVKPGTPEDYRGPVFVIDQIHPDTGKFDEHKVVLGAATEEEARALYQRNYADGWNGLAAITRLPLPAFKSWVRDGAKKEPLGDISERTSVPAITRPAGSDGAGPTQLGGSLAADGRMADEPVAAVPGGVGPAADPAGNAGLAAGANDAPVTFKTSKGSSYVVNGQSTTRDKAARSDVGHEGDSGPQKPSEQTFYVDDAGLQALGEFQAVGAKKRIVVGPMRAAIQYEDGPSAGKFEKRTDTQINHAPAVGLYPVELWKDGRVVHFGNKISEVGRATAAPTPPPFKTNANADGTLLVLGQPDAIKAALPGMKGIAGKRGMTFGKSKASAVLAAVKAINEQNQTQAAGSQAAQQEAPNSAGAAPASAGEGAAGVPAAGRDSAEAARLKSQRAKAARAVDPERDTLLQALAKSGGLNRDEVAREFGLKPEELKSTVKAGNLKAFPFRKDGMSIDRAIESLQQDGYFDGVADDELRNTLEASIFSELGGDGRLSTRGQMRQAEEMGRAEAERSAQSDEGEILTDDEVSARDELLARYGISEQGMGEVQDDDIPGFDDNFEHDAKALAEFLGETYDEAIHGKERQAGGKSSSANAEEDRSDASEGATPTARVGSEEARDTPAADQGLTLQAQTTEDLRTQAAATEKAQAADNAEQKRLADKAKADAERDEFTLTGSDSARDVAAAAGQNDLFPPAPAPKLSLANGGSKTDTSTSYAASTNPGDLRLAARVQTIVEAATGRPGAHPVIALDGTDASPELRSARAIARGIFGHKVLFVRQPNGRLFDGIVNPDANEVLIDVDAGKPVMAVLGHELLHRLRAARPEVYDALKARLDRVMKDNKPFADKLNARRAERGLPPMSLDVLAEERIADTVGDQFTDAAFWRDMAAAEPSTFRKIADAVLQFIDDVLAKVIKRRPFGSDQYIKNMREARAAVVEAMGEFSRGEQAPQRGTTEQSSPGSPGGSDIRMSLADKPGWAMPEGGRFDNFVYKFQNKNVDLKRAIGAINADGGAIEDRFDAYLQEELFHGRAAKRTQDFANNELQPLLTDMKLKQVSMEQLDQFLHARHAKEANELIAERDEGLSDGGSGMMTADAEAYLQSLDPAVRARLDMLAARVDAMLEGTRQTYVGYGLESQATVDGWKAMFKHYVPLMREDKGGGMGIGQGFSIKGREAKHRTGSTAKVVDILGNIALQREKAIVRGEKNRVAVALAGLVKENPNPDVWKFGPVPERRYNPDTNTVEMLTNGHWKSADNVMVAKIMDKNGDVQERGVIFNEHSERAVRMANALKNLDAQQLEGVLAVSAKVTRYFSAINTQYNPVFGAVNLTRDISGAAINLSSTELAGQQAKLLANIPSALRTVYRTERGKAVKNDEMARLWEELQNEGGMTGFRDLYRSSSERVDALKNTLDPTRWTESTAGRFFTAGGVLKVPMVMAQRGMTPVFDWLSDYNQAMEGSTRLAAYKLALEHGMSKQRAASLAKNLTVNFNRKGQTAMQAGALYAFFNASMQGTARMGEVLADTKNGQGFRLTSMGLKIIGGGVALGAMQAVILAMAGFDDDDPPDFVRERNLIIPTGWATGKKDFITIPMPLGWHVLPNLGRVTAEFSLSGFKNPGKRVGSMLGILADSFNPIGNAGLSWQTVTPTAVDPIVALLENRDWTGKPIARQGFSKNQPGFLRTKDTASAPAKWVAQGVNWMTGGSSHTAGTISPTPDQIDYLIGQVTGGVGREASKAQQTVSALAAGEELPKHKVPLVGRFYGESNDATTQAHRYYSNVEQIRIHAAELKGIAQEHDDTKERADAMEAYKANHPEAVFAGSIEDFDRKISELRKFKRQLIQQSKPRSEVKAIEAKLTEAMTTLNQRVARVKAEAEKADATRAKATATPRAEALSQ